VDNKRFEGRIVLITGASSGIGRATAERFADEGARLALLDRDQAAGIAVKDGIEARGGDCAFHHVDISDESAIISAINQIQSRFQSVDHVVNCAGITVVKKIEECTAQDWDYVLNVNLRSVFLIAKYVLSLLRSSQHPTIVNVASVSSMVAQIGTAAYVASKGGVLMLSKALALDLAEEGIRVNCVCPGITDTPMFRFHMSMESNPIEATQERISRVPLGRALLPREIADAILYLSSDQSSGITGTSLVVDAGYTATAEWSRGAVSVHDSNSTKIRDG
jgi:NAD(P)-dependent dehydrogenase (short-subunit alcohol dehydrogenase family)